VPGDVISVDEIVPHGATGKLLKTALPDHLLKQDSAGSLAS
jgi:hypothetical protein